MFLKLLLKLTYIVLSTTTNFIRIKFVVVGRSTIKFVVVGRSTIKFVVVGRSIIKFVVVDGSTCEFYYDIPQ
jgi:hypothetical protein